MWVDKRHPSLAQFDDIRATSNVLFAICERWPTATRFRDCFEVLAQRMIGLVSTQFLHGDLDNTSVLPENRNFSIEPIPESIPPLPTDQDDFWAMLDELVDDEYIRSQFQLDEIEVSSRFLDV
jgi:hypothetical protein